MIIWNLEILLFSLITGVRAASPEACRNLPRATWENHLAGRESLRDKAASCTGWLALRAMIQGLIKTGNSLLTTTCSAYSE